MEKDGVCTSYSDIRGEWESRKIPIVGVVKSFIGQLKVGQELTRVSIPSVFLRPYSLLEEFGSRNLAHFDILFKVASQQNPVDRMVTILTWIASCTREEDFNHKPYNPVLGENHICKTEVNGSTTYFLSEQVSHHPPVTAFRIENSDHKIQMSGTYAFSIQFGTNSLTIGTGGRAEFRFGDEVYTLEKVMPDMAVRNTILPGRKYVIWIGKITIVCPSTQLSADLTWDFRDYTSVIDGIIYKDDSSVFVDSPDPYATINSPNYNQTGKKAIVLLRGKAGGELFLRDLVPDVHHSHKRSKEEQEKHNRKLHEESIKKQQAQAQEGYSSWMWKGLTNAASYVTPLYGGYSEDKSEEQKHDFLLINMAERHRIIPKYPLLKDQSANSSMKVWAPLSAEIIAGDFYRADEEKKKIEDTQRAIRHRRTENNESHSTKYFEPSKDYEGHWVLREEFIFKLGDIFAGCFTTPISSPAVPKKTEDLISFD